jgi:CBS domain-containing protein
MVDQASFTAGDLMPHDVAAMNPETPLLAGRKLMVHRHINGIPVVDDAVAIVAMGAMET